MRGRWIAQVVARPVTTAMVTLALLIFGVVAATRLPVNLLPDISFPSITIQTAYQDAAPSEVETLITRPIEELVSAVPGLVGVESVSRESSSEVVLNFAWGTSIDRALGDIREKLDRVELPSQAERPIVLRYDPSQDAIMRIAAVPGDTGEVNFAQLRLESERAIKLELEKLPGVAAVVLHGGDEDEIRIELDPRRLSALQVTPQQVVTAIDGDNVNRPGGAIDFRDRRHLIRAVHEATTPADLEAVVIRNEGGRVLRVRDLGTVAQVPIEREELALVNGVEAVELAVYREGDANTVSVAKAVRARLAGIQLSRGARVEVLEDRAIFIESAVQEVISNVLIGGLLAVFVLLAFLRDIWSTIVVALAIPISVLVSFVPINVAGVSLNLMSLGGLALGVGMLVDNSIVTLEAIARVRTREPSRSARDCAIQGTAEVASAVVASTLTTVAVFIPLVFVTGVAGQLVRDLALAVTFSILSSMLVSITVVPVLLAVSGARTSDDVHASRALPGRARRVLPALATLGLPAAFLWLEGNVRIGVIAALSVMALPVLSALLALAVRVPRALRRRAAASRRATPVAPGAGAYSRWLDRLLRHPAKVVLVAVALTGVAWFGAGGLGRALIPSLAQQQFFIQVTLPQGTAIEKTTEVCKQLMRRAAEDPDASLVYGRVGSLTRAGSAAGALQGTHLAQIDVQLAGESAENRAAAEARILATVSEALDARGSIRLEHPSLISFAAPIELRVFSDDLSVAGAASRAILPQLEAIAALEDVTPDDLSGRPEVAVAFDRVRLGALDLSIDDAASVTQAFIQGQLTQTKLHTPEAQLDIRVQLPPVDRSDEDDVRAIQVGNINGIPVRLSSVATIEGRVGPAEIRRIEGQRGVRIHARLADMDLARARDEVARVAASAAASDVQFEIAGQARAMDDSLTSMLFAAALAVFLVYVVMASTFESLHHPLLIMCTVPLAIIGVVAALWLTGLTISAMVGIGVIILGGIVVNNAIVLVSAINLRRGRGRETHEAILEGSATRVRPILMTTVTTVLGLAPMALGLGDGAALRQPLAVSVIGGLLSSTLLTLAILPAVYRLFPGRRQDAWGDTDATGADPGEPAQTSPAAVHETAPVEPGDRD